MNFSARNNSGENEVTWMNFARSTAEVHILKRENGGGA